MSTTLLKLRRPMIKNGLLRFLTNIRFSPLPITILGRSDSSELSTHDDAMQVIKEEFSEDFELVGKLKTSDRPYLTDNPFPSCTKPFCLVISVNDLSDPNRLNYSVI